MAYGITKDTGILASCIPYGGAAASAMLVFECLPAQNWGLLADTHGGLTTFLPLLCKMTFPGTDICTVYSHWGPQTHMTQEP